MTDGPYREPGTAGTLRGIVFIVATGAVLGVMYNALGLAGRPARGLAWIKPVEAMVSLESLQPPAGGAPAGRPDTAAAAVPSVSPPPASTPPAGAPPSSPPPAGERPAPAGAPGVPQPLDGRPSAPAAAPPGVAPSAAPPAASALPTVPDLDRPIKVELATLKRLYDAGAVLVVDARDAEEYAEGHIAGALQLSYNDAMAEPERLGRMGENGRPIAVYCSGGTCEASMDLAKFMLANGRRRVLVYEGGWPEWRDAGYPVARGAAAGGR